MKTLLIFLAMLACFGVVGRIDYEVALAEAAQRAQLAWTPGISSTNSARMLAPGTSSTSCRGQRLSPQRSMFAQPLR